MSRINRKNARISRLDEKAGADDYWLNLTPEERVELAWELSAETWQLAHPDSEDEPGLPRSVARVVRGGS